MSRAGEWAVLAAVWATPLVIGLRIMQVRRAARRAATASAPAAQRHLAIIEAVAAQNARCGLCGEQPDLLQLIELYDGADLFCSSCARLFVGPLKEAA